MPFYLKDRDPSSARSVHWHSRNERRLRSRSMKNLARMGLRESEPDDPGSHGPGQRQRGSVSTSVARPQPNGHAFRSQRSTFPSSR